MEVQDVNTNLKAVPYRDTSIKNTNDPDIHPDRSCFIKQPVRPYLPLSIDPDKLTGHGKLQIKAIVQFYLLMVPFQIPIGYKIIRIILGDII